MLEFCTEEIFQSVSLISQFRQQIYADMYPAEGTLNLVGGALGGLQRNCEELGLQNTLAQIVRIKAMFSGEHSRRSLNLKSFADASMEVCVRLFDELGSRKCFIIDVERNSFVSENHFAPEVGQRFPDAIPDMNEAARCFAFERPTACIFHLMRVTEYALREIANLLEINDHNPTWEPIIKKIDAELKTGYKNRKFKGNQEVLANMSSHLHAVKMAWRNRTMHVDKINTMVHAREIYDATSGLMRYLAENLPQKKTGVVQTLRGTLGI